MNNYTAMDVANYIVWYVNNSEEGPLGALTPLKLQKILYYVSTTYLKKYNRLLFSDSFQKWQYGPVVKDVYHEFKTVGVNHITSPKLSLHEKALAVFGGMKQEYDPCKINSDKEAVEIITQVVNKLISRKAFDLVELTHKEVAWKDCIDDIMLGKELTYTAEELYSAEVI